MGQIDLQQVQVGKETTWGTAVNGSAKLMDVTDLKINGGVKTKMLQTRTGSIGGGQIVALESLRPTASLKGIGNYEDMLYWWEGLFGEATPSGGGPYVRTYAAPLTAVVTPRKQTLIYGNATDGVYKLAGTIPTKLSWNFENNKETDYAVDLLAKTPTSGSLAALSDRTINPLMGNDIALYIDAWGGTVGSTAIAATAFSGSLEIDTKRAAVGHLGALGADAYSQPLMDATLKLKVEFTSAVKAFYEAVLNSGSGAVFQKLVRLKATSGAAIFQVDFAGASETIPEIFEDKDGLCTLEIALRRQYSSVLTNWLAASSTNAVSALP